MDEIILPTCQADLPVATCMLSGFKNVQRRNNIGVKEVVRSKQVAILPLCQEIRLISKLRIAAGHGLQQLRFLAHVDFSESWVIRHLPRGCCRPGQRA
jgi:hypothetical protein